MASACPEAGVSRGLRGPRAGYVVFASPAPVSWDSSAAGAGLAGPAAGQRVAGGHAAYGAGSVRLGLAAERFPVYVDPSYTVPQLWVEHEIV
jgi:hypothetical protein